MNVKKIIKEMIKSAPEVKIQRIFQTRILLLTKRNNDIWKSVNIKELSEEVQYHNSKINNYVRLNFLYIILHTL